MTTRLLANSFQVPCALVDDWERGKFSDIGLFVTTYVLRHTTAMDSSAAAVSRNQLLDLFPARDLRMIDAAINDLVAMEYLVIVEHPISGCSVGLGPKFRRLS